MTIRKIIYIDQNSRGLNTLPWGTPTGISAGAECALPTDVICDLFVRYDLNHWVVAKVRPMFVSFYNNK